MLRYKEHLYSLGRANDTVLNKLSCIVTWLKRNGLMSIVGLLPGDERPERRETEGQPYADVWVAFSVREKQAVGTRQQIRARDYLR